MSCCGAGRSRAQSFAATDLPFYVAGLALRGPLPSLLRDVPVAIYTAAVATAALLARGRRRGGRAALGVAAVLVLLGLPAGGLAEFVTKGYIRVGTTMGFFAALLALEVPHGPRRSAPRSCDLFRAALVHIPLRPLRPLCRCVGLPGRLPAGRGAVKSYEAIRVGPVALAVMGAVAAAKGLTWLIARLGGYQVLPYGLSDSLAMRDPVRSVIGSAVNLAAYLPELYRCGVPADVAARSILLWVGCLIGPLLVLSAIVVGCPIPIRGRAEPARLPDFVSDVLWVFVVLAIAAFLTNNIPKNRATTRYMIPFVLSGSVLTGRVLADRVRTRGLRSRPWRCSG